MLVLFKEKWNGHCLSARELDAHALSLHYSDRIDELTNYCGMVAMEQVSFKILQLSSVCTSNLPLVYVI